MADIELVIKMPEEEYKNICLMSKDGIGMALYDWIANGTPLPEHHGRLIDADAFQKYCFNKNFDKRLSDGGLATINFFLGLQPTIIEGSETNDNNAAK